MRSREDWERPKTNISGVFVVKLPGRGSKDPELALEIKSRRRPGPAPEEARVHGQGEFEDSPTRGWSS